MSAISPFSYSFDTLPERRDTCSLKWDSDAAVTHPLWVADMDFPTAPSVQAAIMARAQHPCFGYTLVPDAYYEAICQWYRERYAWEIPAGSICYTIGVLAAISATLRAVVQAGDGVVLLTPVYNCFYASVRNAGCQTVAVPLQESAEGQRLHYHIDYARLEAALAHPKTTVLLLSNPHNPVGRIWEADELQRLDALAARYGVVVISDEIHGDLTRPSRAYVPFGRVATQCKWVMMGSPSKTFNIAGLQNAFLVCPDDDLRRRIDRAINIHETCDVNPFGVAALIAAYREGGAWLEALRTYLAGNLEAAKQYLCAQLPALRVTDCEATYLLWIDLRTYLHGLPVADLCARLRQDTGLWLAQGSEYGAEGEGYVRLNVATSRASLMEALQFFTAWMQWHQP